MLGSREMPGARWFEGAELNYAEVLFGRLADDRPAFLSQSERHPLREVSAAELRETVAAAAAGLRRLGVGRGDRVVAVIPNIPEAVIAFLACASLGAIWASCSPDFGTQSLVDRFAQIEPTVLIAVDGYTYGGKRFDRRAVIDELRAALPGLRADGARAVPGARTPPATSRPGELAWADLLAGPAEPLTFEPVPFDHPLWILYSSGTTGLPKAIVHGHGGVVLEHCEGDRADVRRPAGRSDVVVHDDRLDDVELPRRLDARRRRPGAVRREPRLSRPRRALGAGGSGAGQPVRDERSVARRVHEGRAPAGRRPTTWAPCARSASTGSPLAVDVYGWVYDAVKPDVWLVSMSGGTDVVSAFVGGSPLLPVHAGELQARALGAKVEAYDPDGRSVVGETGELVLTAPLPSMPVGFWNDPDGARYRESYFEMYPGVWRHGDWIRITERGSAVIEGRSDSTLNRQGIRFGTSELYGVVERLPEIVDSLVIGLELPGGRYWMPLFVVLAPGAELDDALVTRIKDAIRTSLSQRHVPDAIVAVPAIPRTLTGKKMEVPVKRILLGRPVTEVAATGSIADPTALDAFVAYAPVVAGLSEAG